MDLVIWFNLLLFSNQQWFYLDSYETLEECQEVKHLVEEVKPGLYSCIPRYVEHV